MERLGLSFLLFFLFLSPVYAQLTLADPVPISQGVQDVYTLDERIAPLSIVTPSGSYNYYVKLVDAATNAPVLTAYIQAGNTLEMEVPLGTFRVRYATGEIWYGPELKFGEQTAYAEADATLEFKVTDDKVSGYTIELIRQEGGNLETNTLSEGQF